MEKMSDRRLLCAACNDPSPGPIRRLYYQTRKHGPFFPVLATLKHSGNASLFSGGRVALCTGCSSHLQRQWIAFEKSWTPLEKRSYTLLAAEREHKYDDEQESGSGDYSTKTHWQKAAKTITAQQQVVQHLTRENHTSPVSRFKMAAHRVQEDRETHPAGPSLHDVVQLAREANEEHEGDSGELHLPALASSSLANGAKWGVSDLHDTLQRRMRECTDILIRKVAEVQYEENLRQSQETIREALDRVKKAQDRAQFVKGLGRDLKERLYGELEFRQTNRGLQSDKDSEERDKEEQKHKQILQQLKKEKEWQRRTEAMIAKQEKRIEELRQEVKIEIRGIMAEQNKHYEEMKQMLKDSRALLPHQGSDHAYVSLDGSTRSGSNLEEQIPSRKRRRGRDLKTPLEQLSQSSTPEFYIQ